MQAENPIRKLPQATEFEQRLLGALMVPKVSMDVIAGLVTPEDFFVPQHAAVFAAMLELYRAGEIIAKPSVEQKLRDRALFEGPHASGYVKPIPVAVASDEALIHMATKIREKSQLRALIQAAPLIESLGYEGEADVKTAIAQAQDAVAQVVELNAPSTDLDMASKWQAVYQKIVRASETEDKPTCAWPRIDKLTSGFRPRTFTVWAGAAGSGKSGVIQDLTSYMVQNLGPVVIFATELGDELMMNRFYAAETGIPVSNQMRGMVKGAGWDRLSEAMPKLANLPIYIYGPKDNSLADIRRICRRIQKKHGSIAAVIVDHVDYVRETLASFPRDKHERLEKVYIEIAKMRHEFDTAVHAVQHLNRDGVKAIRPTMSDLKGGGNPEGIADNVILLHRPYPNGNAKEINPGSREAALTPKQQQQLGEWIVAKSRHGLSASVKMHFDGAVHAWYELANQGHENDGEVAEEIVA